MGPGVVVPHVVFSTRNYVPKHLDGPAMATRNKIWIVVVLAVAFSVICYSAASYQVRRHSAPHFHTSLRAICLLYMQSEHMIVGLCFKVSEI